MAELKWNIVRLTVLASHDTLTYWDPDQMAVISDDIYKYIFMIDNFRILFMILLKFVPNDPIDNKSSLVQEMAGCRAGIKPLHEQMVT